MQCNDWHAYLLSAAFYTGYASGKLKDFFRYQGGFLYIKKVMGVPIGLVVSLVV